MDDTLIWSIVVAGGLGFLGISIAKYRTKRQIIQGNEINVYTRLYHWIEFRETNFQFNDQQIFANQVESQITSSDHVTLDKKIREEFDAFVNQCRKWDEMWTIIYDRYTKRDNDILNDFIKPLKDRNFIDSNEYITVVNGINAALFFYNFVFILIDPSIKNAEHLYQRIKEYASTKYHFNPEDLDRIKNEKPEFFDLMYDNLPPLREKILSGINFDELMKQGNMTRKKLLELKESLIRKLWL
jgi:hypothetical protein